MSGCDFVKLSVDQIEELWSQVKENKQELRVTATCNTVLRGRALVEIIVDRWPDWRSVVVKPTMDLPEDDSMTSNTVHVYSTDMNSLPCFLGTEDVLDWRQAMIFVGLDVEIIPVLEAAAAAQVGTLSKMYRCLMFNTTEDALSKMDVRLPAGYTAGELTPEDTQRVFELRTQDKPEASYEVIEYHVRNCPNVCVRDSTGELVGYEFMRYYGALGLLHVDVAHRRKGLAKYLTVTLARKMLGDGRLSFCYIFPENFVSINLHQACGYHALENCRREWFRYFPPGGES